ncbi:ABC transporter permease [Celeribacter sp.]|uniref:ABC transporter permease n=1 Tax=Celeribacter sp. TaxID=1890673 RepID=UPI003A9074F7
MASNTKMEGDMKAPSLVKRLGISSAELQILGALVALVILFSLMFPQSFFSHITLTNMLRVAGILMVVSIGQSFALIVGGFDISVGATMGIASVTAATLMLAGVPIPMAIVAAIAAGSLIGFINGLGIALMGVTPFVMTLGMLTFGRGLADLIAGGSSLTGLPSAFALFGRSFWWGVPSAACIAAIVAFFAWFILQRTRAGLYIYAIGGSHETSRVAGVFTVRYHILAYTICGALAAVSGLMLTSRISVAQGSLGTGYELLAVAAAVIGGVRIGGGVGRLIGVFLGVSLITVLNTGLDIAGVNPFIQQMVTGTVLVVAVIVANARSGSFRRLFRRTT